MTSKVTGFLSDVSSSGRFTTYHATLDCGHNYYASACYEPLTGIELGQQVNCAQCEVQAEDEQWLREFDYKQVHHCRYRPQFGGRYSFYRRDPMSPSGYMIIRSVAATPKIDAILQKKTNCGPLSPTERA